MIIVFQKLQIYLELPFALSLILDLNPVPLRPFLTHPEFDSFLRFNCGIRMGSSKLTNHFRLVHSYAKQEALVGTLTNRSMIQSRACEKHAHR